MTLMYGNINEEGCKRTRDERINNGTEMNIIYLVRSLQRERGLLFHCYCVWTAAMWFNDGATTMLETHQTTFS